MAPGRKRGAKGAKRKSELSLGDLVLAKVKGFPAWPAKISRPEDWERTPDPKKYFVQFFGTEEIAFVAPADIQAFTIEAKNKLSARCKGKTVKYFAQALKEICDEFEELQRENSSGLRNDRDISDLGYETAAVDGVVDNAVEVDLKDGIDINGTNRESKIRGLGNHCFQLDRCSQRQGEVYSHDTKPRILCKGADSKKRNKLADDGANFLKEEVISSSSPSDDLCLKEVSFDNREDNDTCSKRSRGVTEEDFSTCENSQSSDAEGDSAGGLSSGQKDSSLPLVVSANAKHSDAGLEELTNRHKAKKMATGLKRKAESSFEVHKVNSLAAQTSLTRGTSGCHVDLSESGEHSKDVLKRRIPSVGSLKGSSPAVLQSDSDVTSESKAKKLLKCRKTTEVANDLRKNAEGSSKEQVKVDVSGRKMKVQVGHGSHTFVTNEVSPPSKRSKCADVVYDTAKGSLQANRRSDSRSAINIEIKTEDAEVKKSALRVKVENRLPSRAQTGSVSANGPDEDAFPPSKRYHQTLEAVSGSPNLRAEGKSGKGSVRLKNNLSSYDNIKSQATQLHTKRRAVRLCEDEDDDEPKTPVHGGSNKKVHAPSHVSESTKSVDMHIENSIHDQPSVRDSGGNQDGPSKEYISSAKLLNESSPPNLQQTVVKRPKRAMAAHVSLSPGKLEAEKVSSKEAKPDMVSPKKSPLLPAAVKTVVEPHKVSKPLAKISGNVSQGKAQVGTNKASSVVSDGSNYSHNQETNAISKPISSAERRRTTPKSNLRLNDSSGVAGNRMESSSLPGESHEAGKDDKMSLLMEPRIPDSVSMKHLIAAAQAKRRQAHSHNLFHGNANSVIAPTAVVLGGSCSPSPAALLLPSSSMMQPDTQEYYLRSSLASPSSHSHQFLSYNQPDTEEIEDRRVSSGHWPAGDSLSGGTEAAVARDAFEGMIETLSRTKESIARATRLAIDCAKYGIANEVVELLIQKLECEPSFHRRIDLFFLVDSITQCSHSHKGIAGALYIPTVQASLPRLLGAAAPPGANARENRRQCLKVLRLWLERKILPESLLRRYMDDIGVPNDDMSAGFSLRHPSRAERAVDDPIREMEGMMVDEYGSNVTFQLPGFLSSRVFEEEEEDLQTSLYKEADDISPLEHFPSTGDTETIIVTPSDRRHCILEDVDGELEMEDVSGHLKYERTLFRNASLGTARHEQGSDGILEVVSNNSTEFPSPLPVGSPPLPLDSPPPTPPLPTSPPPPPPPLSPSPPPPPPPLSLQPLSLPPMPSVPPPSLLPPQPSVSSQLLHPHQSSILSSSPELAYRPFVPPSGSQLGHIAVNTSYGAHIDAAVRSEMFPQQSSCFMPSGVCSSREASGFSSSRPLDYGHNDMYVKPQSSQPNPQFQPGNAPFTQRPFHPALSPQTPPSHFSYIMPTVQQHPQQPYQSHFSFSNLSDGPRRYVADEQWNMPSNDLNTDYQRGGWMSGGRTSCSGPMIAQEGYFRPTLERPSPNNVGFQYSAPNALPAGAPIPGLGVSKMIPSRPEMSSVNCWRPA